LPLASNQALPPIRAPGTLLAAAVPCVPYTPAALGVLEPPTQDTGAICAMARHLLSEWLGPRPDAAVRLLGVGAADLQRPRQADLFLAPQPKDSRLDAAVDGIRDRFGNAALTRASSLARPRGGAGPRHG
jgi:DNA polymerase-4